MFNMSDYKTKTNKQTKNSHYCEKQQKTLKTKRIYLLRFWRAPIISRKKKTEMKQTPIF